MYMHGYLSEENISHWASSAPAPPAPPPPPAPPAPPASPPPPAQPTSTPPPPAAAPLEPGSDDSDDPMSDTPAGDPAPAGEAPAAIPVERPLPTKEESLKLIGDLQASLGNKFKVPSNAKISKMPKNMQKMWSDYKNAVKERRTAAGRQ